MLRKASDLIGYKRQISIVLVTFGEFHQNHLLYWGFKVVLGV